MLESSFDTCGMTCFDLRTLWEEKKNNNARVRVANVRVSIITWEWGSQRCKAQEKERKNEKKKENDDTGEKNSSSSWSRERVWSAWRFFSLSLSFAPLVCEWRVAVVFCETKDVVFLPFRCSNNPFSFPLNNSNSRNTTNRQVLPIVNNRNTKP